MASAFLCCTQFSTDFRKAGICKFNLRFQPEFANRVCVFGNEMLSGIDVPADTQSDYGRLLENFIAMELKAWHDYNGRKETLCYWRTENGTEVDFVIGDDIAIEVKATRNPTSRNLEGLRKIGEERSFRQRILVCREDMPRMTDEGILILPWRDFLHRLWKNAI